MPDKRYLMEQGDILFSNINSVKHIGKVAYFNGEKPLFHGMNLLLFRTNETYAHSKFIFNLLSSDDFRLEISKRVKPAINQASISGGDLKEINFLSPPLPEQKKIASILTSVDEVIENTQKQIDKLQDLKKATMNELLTKGIGHTEFKDSELGRIPESWEARQVQEIAKIIRGASPRPKGDPRYYGGTVPRLMGSDVTRDGKYVFPKTDFLTPEGAKLSRPMSKGGLTIVCSGTVGVPSILGVDACIHDGFLGLVDISNQCTTEFLYYAFLPLQGKFDSSATHGGVFTNLTTEILKEFIIGIPPLGEQREIVRHISSLDEHLNAQINKHSQTQSLKKSLMQDLLTGKVRVTVN